MHLQLDRRPGIPDVSADGLGLSFTPTPGLVVVATLAVPLADDLVVDVEVLSASHRVHLRGPRGAVACEQVACLGPDAAGLPATTSHQVGGLRLDFTSERPVLDAAGLSSLARGLRRTAGPSSLVVSFPGHHDALTSVQVGGDGWETWHLYPGPHPQAVRTRTTVVQS
ncbi:MAG TPA: DUF2617 family protein [Acidimicrobiales bacterium]|nr:DUF2617 family protein [Acidimicrobiales bacterium]